MRDTSRVVTTTVHETICLVCNSKRHTWGSADGIRCYLCMHVTMLLLLSSYHPGNSSATADTDIESVEIWTHSDTNGNRLNDSRLLIRRTHFEESDPCTSHTLVYGGTSTLSVCDRADRTAKFIPHFAADIIQSRRSVTFCCSQPGPSSVSR